MNIKKTEGNIQKNLLNEIVFPADEKKRTIEDIKMKKIEDFVYKNQNRGESNNNLFDKNKIKSRPLVFDNLPTIIKKMNMDKKIIFGFGAALLVFVAVAGFFTLNKKVDNTKPYPLEEEIVSTKDLFGENDEELEEMSRDIALDDIDQGLSEVGSTDTNGVVPAKIDTASLSSMEKDLSYEIDNFSLDITELESFNGDRSLDNIKTELSGI